MKKILIILILFLLNVSAQADRQEEQFEEFNKWLAKHEFNEYYKVEFVEPPGICEDLVKFSNLWYYNKCDKGKKITFNYKVNTYKDRSEIPEEVKKPNYETLLYFFWRYTTRNWNNNPKYTDIRASENPSKFKYNLRENELIKKQMQKTALLSYLLFEDGKIVIDEISPKHKFGKVFTNETKYHSQ